MKNHPIPLAYFITLRAYGTWLHGDPRGSVNRTRNRYGRPGIQGNQRLHQMMQESMKHPSMYFDSDKRDIIQSAFIACCTNNQWKLHASHIRTNHAHLIIATDALPEIVMQALKAKATTLLRKQNQISQKQKVWVRNGSARPLWSDAAVHYACQYTIFEQGEKMTYFDIPSIH